MKNSSSPIFLVSHGAFGALVLALVWPLSGFSAESDGKAAAPVKPIGMYSKVDSIDAAAQTFTHRNKDGKEVKFVVTGKTQIKNGDKPAAFGDIKVGDTVSGSRIKKSDTEYEVVKITKFGVVAPKPKP
jgi:hypothetical protein